MKAPKHLKMIALCLLIPQILLGLLWLWIWCGRELFFALPEGLRVLCSGYLLFYGMFASFPVTVLGTLFSGMYAWLSRRWQGAVLAVVHAIVGFGVWYHLLQYMVHIT